MKQIRFSLFVAVPAATALILACHSSVAQPDNAAKSIAPATASSHVIEHTIPQGNPSPPQLMMPHHVTIEQLTHIIPPDRIQGNSWRSNLEYKPHFSCRVDEHYVPQGDPSPPQLMMPNKIKSPGFRGVIPPDQIPGRLGPAKQHPQLHIPNWTPNLEYQPQISCWTPNLEYQPQMLGWTPKLEYKPLNFH